MPGRASASDRSLSAHRAGIRRTIWRGTRRLQLRCAGLPRPTAGATTHTRYAAAMDPDAAIATTADGVRISWTSTGAGPTLIHLPGVPFSNTEGEWRIWLTEYTGRAFDEVEKALAAEKGDEFGDGSSADSSQPGVTHAGAAS